MAENKEPMNSVDEAPVRRAPKRAEKEKAPKPSGGKPADGKPASGKTAAAKPADSKAANEKTTGAKATAGRENGGNAARKDPAEAPREEKRETAKTGRPARTGATPPADIAGRTGSLSSADIAGRTGRIPRADIAGRTGTWPRADIAGRTGPLPSLGADKGEDDEPPARGKGAQRGEGAARGAKADPEVARLKKEDQARSARRRNRQLIGLALVVLIVAGAISIVRGGIDLASSLMNSEEERAEYEARFEPMVWFDIPAFDAVSTVDENSIKQMALWGIINSNPDQFSRNDRGESMVPAAEVDQYGITIFGPDFRFSGHESFTDPVMMLTYTYDADTRTYAIPVTSLQPEYLASVTAITRESGGVKRVTIGYVSTRTGDDQMIATPDYDHPARYMDYMLRRDGSEYYLYAIVRSDTQPETSQVVTPDESLPEPTDDSDSAAA